jgi:class I fructose-bisphosphate aldolase
MNNTAVDRILFNYAFAGPDVLKNLNRILMHGRLGGSGKLLILPVDQGFEHGPARSFANNPAAYDPHYLLQLAYDAKLSAFAAPLGIIEATHQEYASKVPCILKLNSNHSLKHNNSSPDQAITASVDDAVRLGCVGVGLTIYPGSAKDLEMFEEARDIISKAKAKGLVAVVWSYPRGGILSKEGETALDVIAYSAHIATLLGAHIIKVKPPTDYIFLEENKNIYNAMQIQFTELQNRIKHIRDCCFSGKRLIVFSGGNSKNEEDLLNEIRHLKHGGADGSIIGRNSFQRPYKEAVSLLNKIMDIYLN